MTDTYITGSNGQSQLGRLCLCIISSAWHMVNAQTLTPLLMCVCVCVCFLRAHTPINARLFLQCITRYFHHLDLSLWSCTKTKCCIRSSERDWGFNGSLYAISNGLCFISHSDDFRPCNGAVPYLVYDQWQYISVLSFGTALLHLLVLAVEFSAVQFEQQRLLLQSFVVIFRGFFLSPLTEVELCGGISHRTLSNKGK